MISISAPVFDMEGAFMLNESSNSRFEDSERRVSRRPTLDGKVVINDSGHTYADSTWLLVLDSPSKVIKDGLERLVTTYQTITLATAKGVFVAVPSKFSFSGDILKIDLLIMRKA